MSDVRDDDTGAAWPDESPSDFRCEVCGRTFGQPGFRESSE
jgi:hypothetical protein